MGSISQKNTLKSRGMSRSLGSQPYEQIADQLQDRPSECPEYRELKRCKQNVDKELAKVLLRRERLNDQIQKLKEESVQIRTDRHSLFQQVKDQMSTLGSPESTPQSFLDTLDSQLRRVKGFDQTLRKLTKRHEKLEERLQTQELIIGKLKAEADRLMDKINQTLRQDSRLKLLIAENYRRLDMRKKAVMDALRITARNIFFRLHEQFRPLYNNYRDDHVMLRILTRASGLICINNVAGKIDVLLWLKGHFSAATRTRFDTFLATASTFINRVLPLPIPVRFGILGSENQFS